ncbi:DUF805 domain-containing protein [Aestuariivirga litoralis]|uniref:DUF805 domain-containing protein n=1 Tax=Aestuariivirga litoralis TaxID=2650924 RepID=A0A2W2B8X1_9HYPH|nr:DUF805 domain-containing protein [Aestuariivirga litoralis]PZF76528.1 DUF805 domain-containing protein [Aestuariivirga litoralis]
MDWKYLFTSLEGRIGRQSYWMGVIAMTVITIIAALIDMVLGTAGENGYGIVSIIVALALIYPAIVLYAKRWHDRGKSGWWTLIGLVPIIGGIWMLVELGFLRGTDGENQYGPDPLRY